MTAPEIGVDDLVDRYDAFLLDAYGVLVHRNGAMPGAAALLARIREAGKQLLLLSNDASRLASTTVARYRGFGLDLEEADVLTSGMLLTPHFEEHDLAGEKCIVLGTEDSQRYVMRAGGAPTGPTDLDATVLVVADDDGYPFLQAVEQALTTVIRRQDAGHATALVLPNPDLIYPQGEDAFGITSGSVALIIERGLAVRFPHAELTFDALGKPYAPMFEQAREALGEVSDDRVVMLGDQLATDILGANRHGIDSVLLGTGVTRLEALEHDPVAIPTYVLPSLD